MKIYEPGGVSETYVAFGDSANFTLSQSTNYFILLEALGARIILDDRNNNIIYVDHFRDKNDIVKNAIEYGYGMDTLFFDHIKLNKDSPVTYELKQHYICVRISEYANSVSISHKNSQAHNEIKPILEKEYYNPEYLKSKFSWLMFWKDDKDKGYGDNVDFLFNLKPKNESKKK